MIIPEQWHTILSVGSLAHVITYSIFNLLSQFRAVRLTYVSEAGSEQWSEGTAEYSVNGTGVNRSIQSQVSKMIMMDLQISIGLEISIYLGMLHFSIWQKKVM